MVVLHDGRSMSCNNFHGVVRWSIAGSTDRTIANRMGSCVGCVGQTWTNDRSFARHIVPVSVGVRNPVAAYISASDEKKSRTKRRSTPKSSTQITSAAINERLRSPHVESHCVLERSSRAAAPHRFLHFSLPYQQGGKRVTERRKCEFGFLRCN